MKFYKDINNEVYAYEEDGSQDDLIGDKVLMTAEEVEAYINPPKTPEQILAEQRAEALKYLADTDYLYTRFLEIGEPVPEDVVLKRKEARDFLRANPVGA